MIDVAVLGLGPWGLAVVERLVTKALVEEDPLPMTIHVIEAGTPGAGVYGGEQPDYLILNTPCGQHSMHPYPDQASERLGTGFFEWATDSGYRWVGQRCEISDVGRPITPHDFLPRRLMGEYLAWFYRCLVDEAPNSVQLVHHAAQATDVISAGDKERVVLDDGMVLIVDHVVVTTGHTANQPVTRSSKLSAYPVSRFDTLIPPASSVAIGGMGLVAIDVVTALTTGRGGRFVPHGDGLRYHPSGNEPRISLFSRSGYPYCAKSIGCADMAGGYRPVVCTAETALALRLQAEAVGVGVDARQHLIPLMLTEMTIAFYAQAARLHSGPDAASSITATLADAWHTGRFETAVRDAARRFGDFDATAHFFVGEGELFVSSKDYQARVTEVLQSDVTEACVPDGASPVKAAYEVLRALRDTVRTVVEFGGLTLESHRDFQANVRTRIARIVAGPPVHRSEQLLALLDAEVVRIPFGPCPTVVLQGDGAKVSSTSLDRPYRQHVDRVIAGHLDEPTIHRSASPMLSGLYRRGRIRQLRVDGEALGSIELTNDFHPVNANGTAESRIWIFGGLTEGARYYTAYIPSPVSRVRAFVDAGICADSIVGEGS